VPIFGLYDLKKLKKNTATNPEVVIALKALNFFLRQLISHQYSKDGKS
jgi:hypothetical protein